MKHILILGAIFLSACAQNNNHKNTVQIDPAFQLYVDQWHQDAIATLGYDIEFDNLIIKFGNIENQGEDGLCTVDQGQTPTIQIDQTYWGIFSGQNNTTEMMALIYHEMGHCILGRVHNNTMIEVVDADGSTATVYESIMNHESLITEGYWSQHQGAILAEYFSTVERITKK